jgi:acetyl-CoA acetyltransferase family protein
MTEAYIPYGAYWTTPFARWQGSLGHLHSLRFAAHVAKSELERRNIALDDIDFGVLGITVPQKRSFWGLPWVTAMMGAVHIPGPTVSQACATGARSLQTASQEIACGTASVALVVAADRTSNNPHVYYPAPDGPGGTGEHENTVWDNFNDDPYARCGMIDTAENVARKWQIPTEEQHEIVLRRYEQYDEATADGEAFHARYMSLPLDVPDARYRMTMATLSGDEGIHHTTRDGLDSLKPIKADGTVTSGAQTHPADGNAGMIVTSRDRARALSGDSPIEIRIKGFGMARVEKAFMPYAPVPAAQRALDHANITLDKVDAVKTHNPFAVNDIVFSRETGRDVMAMNNFGCSLVWGHPHAATGLRSVIELIEELALRGGGTGLFTGCAAGDTAMAVVIEVDGA